MIDSHLHLWDPGRLRYSWLSGDLDAAFDAARFASVREAVTEPVRAIAVQAECDPAQALDEVDWLSASAEEAGLVGIVAWAPLLTGTAIRAHLDALAERPLVVGVRWLFQDRPSDQWLSSEAIAAAREVARRGWTFDVCARHDQLADVIRFVDAVPELRVVVDHLGKPPVGAGSTDDGDAIAAWDAAIRCLAERPSVAVKLSGLPAESSRPWVLDDVRHLLDRVVEVFGPERSLYGSDWPVSGGGAPREYARWSQAVALGARGDDRWLAEVFGESARRWYRLDRVGSESARPAPKDRTESRYSPTIDRLIADFDSDTSDV